MFREAVRICVVPRASAAAEIENDCKGPLFRAAIRKTKTLSSRPLSRTDVWYMIQRRAADVELETLIGCHTFRATGITDYLTSGGRIRGRATHGRTRQRQNHRPLRPAQR